MNEIVNITTTTLIGLVVPYVSFELIVAINIIAAVAIILNGMQVAHIWYMNPGPLTNYRMFLVVLGLSDLGLSANRLFASNAIIQRRMLSSRFLCIGTAIIAHSLLLIGCSVLVLVSIDRFLAITRAEKYKALFFVKRYNMIVYASCLISFLLYGALAIVWRDKGYKVKGISSCRMGSPQVPFAGIISVAIIFLELVIIVIIYSQIIRRLADYLKAAPPGTQSSISAAVCTLSSIIACKIMFWLPIMITVLMRGIQVDCSFCEGLGLVTMSLNCVANPILYGLTSREYRQAVTTKVHTSFGL